MPIKKYNLFLQYRILPEVGLDLAYDYCVSVQIDQFTAIVIQLEDESENPV